MDTSEVWVIKQWFNRLVADEVTKRLRSDLRLELKQDQDTWGLVYRVIWLDTVTELILNLDGSSNSWHKVFILEERRLETSSLHYTFLLDPVKLQSIYDGTKHHRGRMITTSLVAEIVARHINTV